ncbi:MAG: glycosyltransferase family 2 protein [Anaeroplasmataceae bacterium]|nr:glycosyltransferase family 2 protein [Anaeroplasmataceae bacterium]
MDTLYIVIPAYNESENIEDVIIEWYPIIEKFGSDNSRLVVVDDGSKDKTYSILKKAERRYPKLIALTKENSGHGGAVLFGYAYAIKHNADYIFQTDSDGQTKAEEFADFWKLRKSYDAVIGNRIKREDGKNRIFVEKIVCLLLLVYFKVKVPDANAPFRLMKAALVEKYIGCMPETYFLPNIMLTAYFSFYRENITFREITFQPRQKGDNSINYKKIVKIGWNSLYDFHKFKKNMRNIGDN